AAPRMLARGRQVGRAGGRAGGGRAAGGGGWRRGPGHTAPYPTADDIDVPDATADITPDAERGFADPHGLMGGFPEATAATRAPEPSRAEATAPIPKRMRVGVLTGCVQQSLFARV